MLLCCNAVINVTDLASSPESLCSLVSQVAMTGGWPSFCCPACLLLSSLLCILYCSCCCYTCSSITIHIIAKAFITAVAALPFPLSLQLPFSPLSLPHHRLIFQLFYRQVKQSTEPCYISFCHAPFSLVPARFTLKKQL